MSMDWVIGRGEPSPTKLNGTAPITDHESKKVMLRAERHDRIQFSEVVRRFSQKSKIPECATVLRRTSPYYGPSLLLHDKEDNLDLNYQLTAPGPDTFLYLWGAETDEDNFRTSWFKIAEIKAEFANQQPQYDICSDCGEPIKTLEHERDVAFGNCLT